MLLTFDKIQRHFFLEIKPVKFSNASVVSAYKKKQHLMCFLGKKILRSSKVQTTVALYPGVQSKILDKKVRSIPKARDGVSGGPGRKQVIHQIFGFEKLSLQGMMTFMFFLWLP